MGEIEQTVGRYIHLEISGRPCRIYFEQAGAGIPLVCLHTAGSDATQYRHLLSDAGILDRFQVIAFDMPWHGESLPPTGYHDEEYILTTDLYTESIRSFCAALDLENPVIMGCSMGGRIVLHLAEAYPAALPGFKPRLSPQWHWFDRQALARMRAASGSSVGA